MSTEEFHFLRRFPLLFEDLRLLETYSNSVPHSSAVNSGLNIKYKGAQGTPSYISRGLQVVILFQVSTMSCQGLRRRKHVSADFVGANVRTLTSRAHLTDYRDSFAKISVLFTCLGYLGKNYQGQ